MKIIEGLKIWLFKYLELNFVNDMMRETIRKTELLLLCNLKLGIV